MSDSDTPQHVHIHVQLEQYLHIIVRFQSCHSNFFIGTVQKLIETTIIDINCFVFAERHNVKANKGLTYFYNNTADIWVLAMYFDLAKIMQLPKTQRIVRETTIFDLVRFITSRPLNVSTKTLIATAFSPARRRPSCFSLNI